MGDALFQHEPLHSVLEAVGAVTALLLALILRTTNQPTQRAYIVWARSSLIGMGVLDLFHSLVRPGDSFVWLHSLALLVGGLFFALVWLPGRISESGIARALPRIVVPASLALGLASLWAPQNLPTMLTSEGFTTTARAMNIGAGGLFLVACAWYVRGYHTHRRRRDDLLFAAFCLLSGIAGAIFPFSALWGHEWWLWHLARLMAYVLAAWYLLGNVQNSVRSRLEEARRQGHFRTITETATDAIISIDKNRKVIQWNSAASRMFGYTADEALGRSLPFIMAEDVRALHDESLHRVLTTGETRVVDKTYESTGRRREGGVFPVEISLARGDANGEPFFAGIIRDVSARKQMESALRESKEQLESAHRLAHIGVWTWDVAADTIFWSDELCRILGWEPGTHPASLTELQGLYTPESWERLSDAVREATEKRTPYDLELETIHRDGRRLWTQAIGGSKCDGDGRLVQLYGTVQDISERKRVAALFETRLHLLEHAATHALEEFLQETLDEVEKATGSCIGFYHFLDEGQNTIALQAWSTRTHREYCTAQGKGLHYSLDQAGVWVDAVREHRPVIHNDYASLPHRRGLPEGHAPLIRELVVPIFDRGRLVAILGVGNKPADYTEDDVQVTSYLADVAWQITDRKRAEQLAQQLSARNEALLAAVPDIIMEVDGSKVYTWANPAGYAFFGADVIGKEAAEFFVGGQETYDSVAPLFSGDKNTFYVESWQRRCDGEARLLAWWCRALKDESGAVTGALSSARDITERKEAQERLRTLAETQEVLLREVNHRVKNNLTVIISMLHKEQDRLRYKGLAGSATVLQDLHDRIESLLVVHTMLSTRKWQDLDLGELCRKLVSVLVRSRAATAQLSVAESDVTVNSNQAHYLALVLNELATNSLKYASAASPRLEIRLRISREKGDIRIEYRDNGPGYPEAVTRGDYSGTSIGFDLVKGFVVRSLCGRISFHNDNGAVTLIRFPAGNARDSEVSR